ncbi:MAG: PAS domain S-box protein [Bacteroidota bacterium]
MKKAIASLTQVRAIYITTTIFLVVLSIYAFAQIKNLIDSSNWVNHTNQVTLSLEKLSTAIIDAETNQKNFLLVGDSSCLIERDVSFNMLHVQLGLIDSLINGNPQQYENLKTLHRSINEKLLSMQKVMKGYSPLAMSPEFKLNIAEGIQKTKDIKQVINKMAENETHLLGERTQKYSRLAFITPFFIIVLFLGALLILLASYLRINNAFQETKQLEKIAIENAVKLNEAIVSRKVLEDSESRYNLMLMQSPFAFAIFKGKDLVITLANESMKEVLGKGKDIEGKPLLVVLPELVGQPFPGYLENVYKTGIPFSANNALAKLTRNGKFQDAYFNFVYQPYREVDGSISGITCIAYEVTNEFLALKQIQESEKRFRLLADAMPQHIWTSDPQGNLNYYNQSVFDYSGLTLEQINKDGWIQIVHPDDRENNIKEWMRSITTGKDFLFEHRFRRHDGIYHWQLSRAVPQKDEQGKIQMWVGTSTDIQEQKNFTVELEKQVKERTKELNLLNESLKKSEERYHLMVEEVQDYAILYLNREGIVENWNEGVEKIKGYKAHEIIGKSFFNFYTEADRKNNLPQTLLSQAAKTGKAVQEGWRVRKDGSLFWASVVITAVHNDKKELIGFSKVTHDLTEKKAADDKLKHNAMQLEQKNLELEKINKELQSFAYISSHDLQEPLRKIQTFSSHILNKEHGNLSENGKDNFKRIQSAAQRMQTLIEDLLTYSRTNTTERKFENTDLNKIIDQVKEDLREDLKEKQATIEATGLCELNIIPFQFRQLMNNLIGNSLKFSFPDNPAHIKIKSETESGIKFNNQKLSSDKKYCHISVSDNGIGFEQQYSEKIFEVFQRLHGKSEYRGTGIGLSIVKKIVENHGGVIIAKSELNKGATFDIFIPA